MNKKLCQSTLNAKRRRLQWLSENGPCKHCGSWENLEVDHIDPSTKITNVFWNRSKIFRDTESAKCQPLCKACHKIKTAKYLREKYTGVRLTALVHGTKRGYFTHGCKCAACLKAMNKNSKDYRLRTGRVKQTRGFRPDLVLCCPNCDERFIISYSAYITKVVKRKLKNVFCSMQCFGDFFKNKNRKTKSSVALK